ncbi:hypothetical protein F3G20_27800, partial [Klebsiella pneumoniae]
ADFLVWSPPLQFRSCYVGSSPTTYAAKGFRVTDDAGDVPVTRVDIVADTVVDITLGRETTGDVYLWYASQTGSNGNGNLFDSDTTVAVANYEFHEGTGQYTESNIPELVNRPYPLNNPGVAFRRQASAI